MFLSVGSAIVYWGMALQETLVSPTASGSNSSESPWMKCHWLFRFTIR